MGSVEIGMLAGTLTMLGYGVGNLVMKIPISQIGVWRTLFWRCGIQFFLISVFAFFRFQSHEFYLEFHYFLYAAGVALIGFFPFLTFMKSLNMGKVSVVVPVANSSLLFTVLFSGILLGETLSLMGGVTIVLIVVGLILLSLSFDDLLSSDVFAFSSGVPYALFSSFGRGFTFVLFSLLIPNVGRVFMTFIISLVNFVSSMVMMKWHKQDFSLPSWSSLKYVLITAIGAFIATSSYNRGVSYSSTNLIAAIGFSGPLVVVIGSYFLYNERLSLQQCIGVCIVVASIVGFSLSMG